MCLRNVLITEAIFFWRIEATKMLKVYVQYLSRSYVKIGALQFVRVNMRALQIGGIFNVICKSTGKNKLNT